MYLYLIRNTVNQKGYIGITTQSLHARWTRHCSGATTGDERALTRAIRKYGKDAFTMELVAEAQDWNALVVMERDAIQTYNTFAPTGHGYNMTLGGEGALGRAMSAEARHRISLANTGREVSPEAREAVGARHRGVPKSPEQRQKMSESQLGEKNHMYGKPLSEEHKQKLSESHQGQTISGDHLAAMMASVRGKPKTEAHKQKLREAAQARFAEGKHPWLGRAHTEETKAKIADATRDQFARQGNPMQGHAQSEETRRKISEATQGRVARNKSTIQGPLSPEHIAKLREAMQGRPSPLKGTTASPETRAKMSASHRGENNGQARPICLDGHVYASGVEACRSTGLTRAQLTYRLKTGRATFFDLECPGE